jgi:hypothetical protein
MIKKSSFTLFIFLLTELHAFAQPDLSYYLPDEVSYDSTIPTPQSIIGHQVGEYHVTHDRLVNYMFALDKASDRIALEVIGTTHEARPLLLLTITSPINHKNIETIKSDHHMLTEPDRSSGLDTRSMPAIFYLGCSIHGNEASGSNAAVLIAYHLAAAKGPEIENVLQNTVILLDPSFNPDGMQRFSSWVNSRKSKVISTDPNDMEHQEPWPSGRTNHYWFDLNRDWLVAQHPESQARVKKFHEWKPNLLTDHHEMATNSTFFFQPGVPSRTHPLTPLKNIELTKKMGEFHAKALDAIGSFYYTQENFDDYYYGKGSTFPDVQGAIGLLFEQASSRGHAQESTNGVLRFPFTIRNQFVTALSSLAAVTYLREDLLNYQRQFFKDAISDALKDPIKAIIFGAGTDKARAFHLAEIIFQHDIAIHKLKGTQTINGKNFNAESSYVVPLTQPQYKLIKSMFEKRTSFTDSLFYDISTWTLSLASNVDYEELKTTQALGERITSLAFPQGNILAGESKYAYAFESSGYYAPRAINRLLQMKLRIKVATNPFFHPSGKKLERGSILIPVQDQEISSEAIHYLMNEIITKDAIDVFGFDGGLNYESVSLGSGTFLPLKKPEIAMLVDGGVSAGETGELWHLLDKRFNIPVTLIPLHVFNSVPISRYNTIILPPGLYTTVTDNAKEKLKTWTQNGGLIIGFESALNWLHANGLGKFEMKKGDDASAASPTKSKPYATIENYKGAQEAGGSIFQTSVDLTNPLLYGYSSSTLPVFKGNNLFMEPSKNSFGNPILYTDTPLLSGYISKQNYSKLKNSSYAGVSVLGRGRVIGFTDNIAFRGFWFGTNKILMNAIFYGALINEGAAR